MRNVLLATTVTFALSACGGGGDAVDNIIDQIDTSHSADISYVSSRDERTTFYLKSSVYNASEFSNEFRVIDLERGESSSEIQHDWIDGANQSRFATEETITEGSRITYTLDLEDNSTYWAISWEQNGESKISVFEKKQTGNADVYNVRVFANTDLAVKRFGSDDIIATTEAGIVGSSISVQNCTDLQVGGNEIDLCQFGVVGNSYLAIVNQGGQIALLQE